MLIIRFTGTSILPTATAVVSGTEAVMAMITAFSRETNAKVDVCHHQALVCMTTHLFVKILTFYLLLGILLFTFLQISFLLTYVSLSFVNLFVHEHDQLNN